MTLMRRTASLLAAIALLAACQATTPGSARPPAEPSRGCEAEVEPTLAARASAGCLPESTAAPSANLPSAGETDPGEGSIEITTERFRVPNGAHPHDVAPASDGGVWYTGQGNGTLGWLDPGTGEVREVSLPAGAAPHGVVTGPDGAAWITDQGLNAIVRVTPDDFEISVLPAPAGTSPHTPVFDLDGILWFSGAGGWIGRLDPEVGDISIAAPPRDAAPYGIALTPSNDIWFVSLDKSYLGKVDKETGAVEVFQPPTPNAGTRRVWSDSTGRLWVSYWNAGMIAVFDPADGAWQEWDLPGDENQAYSMYVDETDAVWTSDFGQNSVVRFDPVAETFESFASDRPNAAVRQMLGRPGEAWGAESGTDRIIVFRYGAPDSAG